MIERESNDKTNHWKPSPEWDHRSTWPREETLVETRSLEMKWNGNPLKDSSGWGQSSVSVHIGVFDNYYQLTWDIHDKRRARVCKCSLLSAGQGGRVISRGVSVFPAILMWINRDACLSLPLSVWSYLSRVRTLPKSESTNADFARATFFISQPLLLIVFLISNADRGRAFAYGLCSTKLEGGQRNVDELNST